MNDIITLEKIIKRDDYKRLSENLKERAEELAAIICDKFIDLEVKEVLNYQVREYRSNLCTEDRLVIYNEEEGRYHSLQDIGEEFYLHGDFGCRIFGATNAEAVEFLNNVKRLLSELNQIETEKAAEIQVALKEVENI